MRYITYQTFNNKPSEVSINYWLCETYWLHISKYDIVLDTKKNLCIIDKKNKFTYLRVDKEGDIHIRNVPEIWISKRLQGMINAFIATYSGWYVYIRPERSRPVIQMFQECEDWRNSVKYVIEQSDQREIVISIDGKLTGARLVGARTGKTTSQW